MQYKK